MPEEKPDDLNKEKNNMEVEVKRIFRQVRDGKLDQKEALEELRQLNVKIDLVEKYLIDILAEKDVSNDTLKILMDIVQWLPAKVPEEKNYEFFKRKLQAENR